MNQQQGSNWPPSRTALGPSPREDPSGYSEIDSVRRQHLSVQELIFDLVKAIEVTDRSQPEDVRAVRRVRTLFGDLNRLLADHRDLEESSLFLLLQRRRPRLGRQIDKFGEEHVDIFREIYRLNDTLERIEFESNSSLADLRHLAPSLVSFLQKLWKHTLDEEALLRDAGLRRV